MDFESEGINLPCDTIQTSQVNFKMEVTNTDLLKSGLEGLGYRVTVTQRGLSFSKAGEQGTFENGQFNATIQRSRYSNSEEFDVNAVKRAYSKEIIKYTSKRFGWAMEEDSETAGKIKKRVY
jgi:hypothetical protein